METSAALDEFLDGVIDRIIPHSSLKMLDKEALFYYKTLIFKHIECVTSNNQYTFVFDEKALDNIQ
jgi:hypothetical protein